VGRPAPAPKASATVPRAFTAGIVFCVDLARTNFERTLKVLAEFCDIEPEVALPDLPYGAAVGTIVNADAAAAFRELIESGRARELRSPSDRIGGYTAYATLAVDYVDAQRQRTRMLAAFERAFNAYDAVATPTLPTVALSIDLPFDKAYPKYQGVIDAISPGNLTGIPAICFPNGFGENGLPTGFSLFGRPFCEAKLTRIAREYQARTDFQTRRPPVAAV